MVLRIDALRKASSIAHKHVAKRTKSTAATPNQTPLISIFQVGSPKDAISQEELKQHYATISQKEREQRAQDRDFLVSVLESSSATKRDAKAYLQTFGPTVTKKGRSSNASINSGPRAVDSAPLFIQGASVTQGATVSSTPSTEQPSLPHVAVVLINTGKKGLVPEISSGIGKTLAQLRTLGLPTVIVFDYDNTYDEDHKEEVTLCETLAAEIDKFGPPWTRIVDAGLIRGPVYDSYNSNDNIAADHVSITQGQRIVDGLRAGAVVLVATNTYEPDGVHKFTRATHVVLSLVRYLAGLQFEMPLSKRDFPLGQADALRPRIGAPTKQAIVDRVVILNEIGGIPSRERGNNAHVFLNLEDEYATTKRHLGDFDAAIKEIYENKGETNPDELARICGFGIEHWKNLQVVNQALTMLPPSSAALVTTPSEAANLRIREQEAPKSSSMLNVLGTVGTVGTRRSHNPLIHNLLTGRPSFSSSLPTSRIKSPPPVWQEKRDLRNDHIASTPILHVPKQSLAPTTLAKKGMPVTIYPDPKTCPWLPPQPGQSPLLKLTDPRIDLPRLVRLIEDSFGRKLDVKDYLRRVEHSLAGIIIAGEYEGGAILTWEQPLPLHSLNEHSTTTLAIASPTPIPVPYLDKFAVLKRSQGAGGVADIVFNAMVHDCFPEGVCWRSRKSNPVNKWYFERSRGTWKLGGTDWAMFWTTPDLVGGGNGDGDGDGDGNKASSRLRDYEDVCRRVVPSWADGKDRPD